MFLFDMIFCFFQEYIDAESFHKVTNFKIIAKRYARKSFVYDLFAWLPIDMFFKREGVYLFRLLKLLRIPRLFELLDVEKFKQVLNLYYQVKLDQAVAQENY